MQTDSKQSSSLEDLSSTARVAALGFALSTALACASVAPLPPAEPFAAYRVGAPDQLLVSILPDPPIQAAVVVRPDGMITVELVGDVPAAGRTPEEIARDLEARIARFKRGAKATVSVVAANSTAVTVLGEVRRPSRFPMLQEMRVVGAIGQASGVTTFASQGRIRVLRFREGITTVHRVDLGAIQRGDLSTNIMLARGDVVYVPPTMWARVGYAVQAVLFPFQPVLGIGQQALRSAIVP
jgi:polysaccharide export outer membrane protein